MKTVVSQLELSTYGKMLKNMAKDPRMTTTHLGLFTALFVQWERNGFNSPFPVTRKELMIYSRIASTATYHKCIRQLDDYGYIRYQPSFDPLRGSLVYWFDEYNQVDT